MNNDLLQRYIEGNVTDEEAAVVVAWLDEDEQHVKEFMALHQLYAITTMNPQPGQPALSEATSSRWFRIGRELLKVAAVVLIVLGGRAWWNSSENVEEEPLAYQTLIVPAGQRAELVLPDSTKVWLNAHSKLVYPVSFRKDNRQVELEGEAYFEVKRKETVPFVVKTREVDVKVLGTEFNVQAYPESQSTEVALLKGRVELDAAGGGSFYRMKPGEQVTLKDRKYTSAMISDTDYFKWKEGLICFKDQSIRSIMDKLSVCFDVKIQVENQALLAERYTGKFRTKDGVEQVLKVLQLEHRFSYSKDNERNEITIK